MQSLLTFLFLLFFYDSIGQNGFLPYVKDRYISDSSGKPRDSLTFYIPVAACTENMRVAINPKNGNRILLGVCDKKEDVDKQLNIPVRTFTDTAIIDTLLSQIVSYHLYRLDEPILYNYYQNTNIYRYSCFVDYGGHPYTITIYDNGDSCFITSKMCYVDYMPDPNYIIPKNDVRPLDKKQFRKIKRLLASTRLKKLTHTYTECPTMTHQSPQLLEVHTKNGYNFVVRMQYRERLFKEITKEFNKLSNMSFVNELYRQQFFQKPKTLPSIPSTPQMTNPSAR